MDLTFATNCSLFENISTDQLPAMLTCLSAQERIYAESDYIFRAGDAAAMIGVVTAGTVHVINEDFWGRRQILAHMTPGDLFGESYACTDTAELPVSVIAASADTRILLMNYRRVITVCSDTCVFHMQLIRNMLQAIATRNLQLMQQIEHVSRRTTREKVLSYLSAQALRTKSIQIEVPFNRQELADFLCVERSALSRELSQMQKDGLLTYQKNQFTLKTDQR